MTEEEYTALHKRLIQAIADPGHFLPRGDNYEESIPSWGARAVIALFDAVRQPPTYKPKPGWAYNPDTHVAWQTRPGGAVCAGVPAAMASKPDACLIEVPGEVLLRLKDQT